MKRVYNGWNIYWQWTNWTFGLWWDWRKTKRHTRVFGVDFGPFQAIWRMRDALKPRVTKPSGIPGHLILHEEPAPPGSGEAIARYFSKAGDSSAHFIYDPETDEMWQNLPQKRDN